ncbi:MAG: hypothetical protein DPW16_15225 [Chloroflexi bacterium]|nr:hypothetical protein [Chloroflexota bacterium]
MRALTAIFGLMLAILAAHNPVFARQKDAAPTRVNQQEVVNLRVWWPDALLSENAADTLENQFDSFRSAYVNVNLDLRYLEYQPIDTIRRLTLTRDVAPDALPDLTLMRYEEMMAAVNSGLLQPVEGLLPPSTLNDLSDNVLEMGQVAGEFYGIPYLLSIDHMLYTGDSAPPPRNFSDFLEQDTPLLFAAKPATSQVINELLLIQYLAEGGYLVDQENVPALNEDALLTVLEFYSTAVQLEPFRQPLEDTLQLQTLADYRAQLSGDDPVLALLNSTDYLLYRNRFAGDAKIVPPLTADGQSFTLLDGWMWVLLADDATRQIQARNFLTWMMNSDNLTDTALALNMLPSQQRALRVMAEDSDLIVLSNLINAAYFLPPAQRQNVAAVALQVAFESVLQGITPRAAAEIAMATLGN